ncbi:MAG: BirA family transcriptional regulator [Clostridia bacterium]|nr:BirA family transcriptional regulator [Clostridia bacterium]
MNNEVPKSNLLEILRRRQGTYVSGEDLSRLLGVSRTAIWKQVRSLRREGYEIDAQPRLGYCLLSVPDAFYPDEVLTGLKTSWLGRSLYYYDEVGSTNQVAKELADAGAGEGTLVIAERQTSGRGRLGRSWVSPPRKGAWFSLVLRPRVLPAFAPQLTLLAAVAVQAAIRDCTGLALGIKWPNDLLARGRKICGILTEMKAEMDAVDYLVLGIGLNINLQVEDFPPELRDTASSLLLETGRQFVRVPLLQAILAKLEDAYTLWQEEGFAPIRRAWKEANVVLGQKVRLNSWGEIFEGEAVDIDETGALLIKEAGGRVLRFASGEVSLRW